MSETPHLSSGLTLDVRSVQNGETLAFEEDNQKESLIVILSGWATFSFPSGIAHFSGTHGRNSVFEGTATSLYVPKGEACEIAASSGALEIAIVSATATNKHAPFLVPPRDVTVEERGRKEWSRRVETILGGAEKTDTLIIGETFSGKGVWSGYPPHKHDQDIAGEETRHQEVFLFKCDPRQGFGICVGYDDSGEPMHGDIVRHNDKFVVSKGYHSIVVAAGYQLYYLWALSGSQSMLQWRSDPTHAWID